MAMEATTRPKQLTLPNELISLVISHLYETWSLLVLDRLPKLTVSCLAISGTPSTSPSLLRASRLLNTLATYYERSSFSGRLIFTTSSTHWRTLTRLQTLSPTRMGWVIDHITMLVFSSPPLFTSRIPYAFFAGLRRIELDYRGRSSKFRCQGQLREAEASTLASLIVSFARDTDRFDGAIVEDAWGVVPDDKPDELSDCVGPTEIRLGSPLRAIEVLVVKRMQVYHHKAQEIIGLMITERVEQIWDLIVTATYRGKLDEVGVEVRAGEGSREFQFESVIWTPNLDCKHDFRDKLAAASRRASE